MTRKQLSVVIAMGAIALFSFAGQVEAGTCQPVKAKGVELRPVFAPSARRAATAPTT